MGAYRRQLAVDQVFSTSQLSKQHVKAWWLRHEHGSHVRRGIAANPYIAEGLIGRTKINEHLYWHASTRNGPAWATDYLSAPVCDWTAQEIDFVDWVFNSAVVLRERASLMEQHEGLTYERDAARREPFALRSSYFVDELTDDLSIAMVKRIQNRYGVEIWPWERAGFTRAK